MSQEKEHVETRQMMLGLDFWGHQLAQKKLDFWAINLPKRNYPSSVPTKSVSPFSGLTVVQMPN
jgi:hypothetical protein